MSGFDEKLEQYAVAQGWFTEPPRKAMSRWVLRGVLAIVAGGIAIFGGVNLPSQGLLLLGVARDRGRDPAARDGDGDAGADDARGDDPGDARGVSADAGEDDGAGAVDGPGRRRGGHAAGSRHPTRRSCGAWRWDSRSRSSRYWSGRSTICKDGRVQSGYLPVWYGSGGNDAGWNSSGGSSGWAPGLMSGSAIPNFGGMMAALSTIGNSPSSSGSGGGYGGGGSGGGGGAGGGF